MNEVAFFFVSLRVTITMTPWTHLIRFVAAEDGVTYFGQLSAASKGLGSQTPKGITTIPVVPSISNAFVITGDPLGTYEVTNQEKTVRELLSPIGIKQCPIIRCVGLNYIKHILEGNRVKEAPAWPTLFIKPRTAIANPFEDVKIPKCAQDQSLDYEGEFCIVISKDCRDVPSTGDEWKKVVAGFTVGNDISWRTAQHEPEKSGTQWCMGKGLDRFAPLGPVLVSGSALDTSDLGIQLRLNGVTMQEGRTSQMLHDARSIVSHFSVGTTLEKGTVIMTGTPQGVGYARKPPVYLKSGDKVEVEVEGIGTLEHGISYE